MAVTLNDISKSFDEQLVVSRLSLEIQTGELFVLLGSSGSGKSTILRLIAGLLAPDSGSIKLHGIDVTTLPPQRRNIGFVFQNYAIFKHMTVARNIEFGLRIRGVAKVERQRRREELIELVGLGGLGNRMPGQLSGGQRQRVALARALAYQPALLLLDEPFGALDVKIRSQLRRALRDIQRQLQVTTILVTHDQLEAFALGDRIGVLERGHLVEVGTPQQLYHRPRSEYVATFLGGGNVLVGRVEGGKIRLGATLVSFPAGTKPQEDGAPVRILFRPETVVAQREPFPENSSILPIGQGTLIDRTFGGATQNYRFELETLQGTRPLEPALAYGQRSATIHASAPSEECTTQNQPSAGEQFWIGLSHYHVLAPTGFKILAYVDPAEPSNLTLQMAGQIELAAHGPLTAVSIAPSSQSIEASRLFLKQACEQSLKGLDLHLEMRTRAGTESRELIHESQEGFYDLAILPWWAGDEALQLKTAALARRLLYIVGVPILIPCEPLTGLKRILVCTAAGEPGKEDIRFGARLARHTQSHVTLFHAVRGSISADYETRISRYMGQASALMEALRVKSEIKLAGGAPASAILKETREGLYDLVIIGAPSRYGGNPALTSDLAAAILNNAKKSVVIVPTLD